MSRGRRISTWCLAGLLAACTRASDPARDVPAFAKVEIIGPQRPPAAVGDSTIVCALGQTADRRLYLLAPAYVLRRRSTEMVEIHTRWNPGVLCRAHAIEGYEVRAYDWRIRTVDSLAAGTVRM
ncbi:MAG TPA: hypothetical protein VF158_02815 [Longimicrobiales bacterium]